ncbi:MAG: thioredoxin family protein [Hylemonella sp.]|uniref:thioredoxin family protein n=1 Tax=Hylemonella sp. TaxID=2066020 RepID=UPI0022C0F55D|nr:thioredoxin family protein [Hylemonella sp.]MCZ8253286.1 thioredoxin family protein [Hylemonella sp.]
MNSLRHVLAMLALLLSFGSAQALNIQPYSPAALQAAQQAGQPVALHFHADWCPTCRAQEKVFQSLKGNASLPLTLLVVNYDKERELKRALKVRAQSTLIVYRGSQETRRSGGETEAAALRDALKSAL